MDRITTTIGRRWLADIVAGRKPIEYREAKPYWRERLKKVGRPFELRMINGMRKGAPEVTVIIDRVTESKKHNEFRLHISEVAAHKHWDRHKECPK